MDTTSYVKVDRFTLEEAWEGYQQALKEAEKNYAVAVLKYKDTVKFNWWDKWKGRDKWSSEELLNFDVLRSWLTKAGILRMAKLISREDYEIISGYGSKWRDEVSAMLDVQSSEFYLCMGTLRWVNDWRMK